MTQISSESLNWIQSICKRFSEATEWPLYYTEDNQSGESQGDHAECCWFYELKIEQTQVGFFHMDLPEKSQSDRFFLTVKELAEIIVKLIEDSINSKQLIQNQKKDVNTFAKMGMTIGSERDLVKAMHQLLKAAVELTGYLSAAFFLLDPERTHLTLRGQYRVKGHSDQFEIRRKEDHAPDFKAITRNSIELQLSKNKYYAKWLPDDAKTGFCCPVVTSEGPLGTLWVYDRREKQPTERDQHVLMSVAVQIANLLERVVLLQESSLQHRIQHDLKIASETQVHGRISDEPHDMGLEIAVMCKSRYEVGGDLFELIPIDENRTVITIGDASGDSVPAAMVMSSVRGALRAVAKDPHQDINRTDLVMQKINAALYSITPAHQFMSMLFAVYDKSEGTFTYTNAGHPAPIHCHLDHISTLQSHGMLLGVLPDGVYERSILKLGKDDVLVMYSDGISEAMNQNKKLFRSEGIIGAVKHFEPGTTADTILNRILTQVNEHTRGSGGDDDKTLLVIRAEGIKVDTVPV